MLPSEFVSCDGNGVSSPGGRKHFLKISDFCIGYSSIAQGVVPAFAPAALSAASCFTPDLHDSSINLNILNNIYADLGSRISIWLKLKVHTLLAHARALSASISPQLEATSRTSCPALPPKGTPHYITASGRVLTGKRLDTFLLFWKAFDLPKAKAEAADAWLDIPVLTNSIVRHICNSARLEAEQRPELVRQRRYFKYAKGWLNDRRWEDWDPPASTAPTPLPKRDEPDEDALERARIAREKVFADLRARGLMHPAKSHEDAPHEAQTPDPIPTSDLQVETPTGHVRRPHEDAAHDIRPTLRRVARKASVRKRIACRQPHSVQAPQPVPAPMPCPVLHAEKSTDVLPPPDTPMDTRPLPSPGKPRAVLPAPPPSPTPQSGANLFTRQKPASHVEAPAPLPHTPPHPCRSTAHGAGVPTRLQPIPAWKRALHEARLLLAGAVASRNALLPAPA